MVMISFASALLSITVLSYSVSSFRNFRTNLVPTFSRSLPLDMCKSSPSPPSPPINRMQKRIKSAIAAVVIASATADVSFALPDSPAVPITRSVLESSVQALESSNSRSEVVQSLQDVFAAAGSKTLLVRTKYKYVSRSLI
jgi:hypothetical protein